MPGAWYLLPMIVTALVGVIGTVSGAILTYKANRANAEATRVNAELQAELARRRESGSIETSNANDLWQENQRLIDRLIKEIDAQKAEYDRRMAAMEAEYTRRIGALEKEIDRSRDELKDARGEILAGRIERDALRDENKQLTKRVHDLELEVVHLRGSQPIGTQQVVSRIVETVTTKPDTPPDAAVPDRSA